MKKICFYSPYIPTSSLGGGERHLFSMALVLSEKYKVDIAISNTTRFSERELKEKYGHFLGTSLDKISFVSSPLGTKDSMVKKIWWTKKYDHLSYWSDGSLFFSAARSNSLHLQIPFTHHLGITDRLKLLNWGAIHTNSEFTKSVIEKNWHIRVTDVLFPAVDCSELQYTGKKEQIIVSVGRFFRQLHSKKQDVLVKLFRQLQEKNPNSWKLVLIGACEDPEYVSEIRRLSSGLNVEMLHDVARTDLVAWYQRASIYWHATGFGVNTDLDPQKAEHFGITTLEAMAAGCVPVVFNAGGQPEVLGSSLRQFLWNTADEATATTLSLMASDEKLSLFRDRAAQRSRVFDTSVFKKNVFAMMERLGL